MEISDPVTTRVGTAVWWMSSLHPAERARWLQYIMLMKVLCTEEWCPLGRLLWRGYSDTSRRSLHLLGSSWWSRWSRQLGSRMRLQEHRRHRAGRLQLLLTPLATVPHIDWLSLQHGLGIRLPAATAIAQSCRTWSSGWGVETVAGFGEKLKYPQSWGSWPHCLRIHSCWMPSTSSILLLLLQTLSRSILSLLRLYNLLHLCSPLWYLYNLYY